MEEREGARKRGKGTLTHAAKQRHTFASRFPRQAIDADLYCIFEGKIGRVFGRPLLSSQPSGW